VRAATERGVLSQVAVRLFAQNKHIAGLNLYSTDRADVDPDAPEIAQLFATHAGILVGRAQNEHHLHQALETRKTIGQAIGIVMERYRIDAEAAFQFLIRTSMASNIKVRDVAEEVVTASVESYRRSSAPSGPGA
jgi:ANTAR domain